MTEVDALRDWLGITGAQARLLLELHKTPRPLHAERLGVRAGITSRSVAVYVSALRTALNDGAIDTLPGEGYLLTATGRSEVAAALARDLA